MSPREHALRRWWMWRRGFSLGRAAALGVFVALLAHVLGVS